MFNEIFGPSIYLLILDLFLDKPEQLLNMREIARNIGKNPGSVSRVIPRLIEESYVDQIPVGNMFVFRLNGNNEVVQILSEFKLRLGEARK
jgi:predicted transcriptional regulator